MSENEPKLKITFEDKQDSYVLNSNSKYVLTAANVNEIKEVVNNLSDTVANINLFSDMFRYVRFIVPEYLAPSSDYELAVEIANNPDFLEDPSIENSENEPENRLLSISSARDNKLFYIFKEDKWQCFNTSNKKYLKYEDRNAAVKIDIIDFLKENENAYYGRYKWINKNTSFESAWHGVVIGSYGYYNDNFELQENGLKSIAVLGPDKVSEGSSANYTVIGVKNDGQEINLTPSSEFTSLQGVSFLSGTPGFVQRFPLTSNEIIDLVKAKVKYNDYEFTAFKNTIITPIKLERITIDEINDSLNSIAVSSSVNFKVNGHYSDGTTVRIPISAAQLELDLGDSVLSESSADANGYVATLSAFGEYDCFGTLKATYHDPDFPNEFDTCTKYIRLKSDKMIGISVVLEKDLFDLTSNNENSKKCNYEVIARYLYGSTKNITKDTVVRVINGDEVSVDRTNGIISINAQQVKDGKNVGFIFSYKDNVGQSFNEYTVAKNIRVKTTKLCDMDVVFKQRINGQDEETNIIDLQGEEVTLTYQILPILSTDGVIRLGTITEMPQNIRCELKCESETEKVEIDNGLQTINFRNFENTETVIFKCIAYYYNSDYTERATVLDRVFSVVVNPLKLNGIKVKEYVDNEYRDIRAVDSNSTHSFAAFGVYSNGIEKELDSECCSISFAAGDPSVMTNGEINGMSISFGALESTAASKNVAFALEYFKNNTFKTKLFSITINNR